MFLYFIQCELNKLRQLYYLILPVARQVPHLASGEEGGAGRDKSQGSSRLSPDIRVCKGS